MASSHRRSGSSSSSSSQDEWEQDERPEVARTAAAGDACVIAAAADEPAAAVEIAEGRESARDCDDEEQQQQQQLRGLGTAAAPAELLTVLNCQTATGSRKMTTDEAMRLLSNGSTFAASAEELNSLGGLLKLRRALGDSGSASATTADCGNELSRVLRLRRAISDRKEESSRERALATMAFLLSGAAAAVNRANDLRMRHPHCSSGPLTLCYWLSRLAAGQANDLAMQEEREGLTQELLSSLGVDAVRVAWQQGESGESATASCGVCICRLPASCLGNVPLESVNYWYKQGKFFPYSNRPDCGGQTSSGSGLMQFRRLLGASSRHMGWGAALAGNCSAVYAVAILDAAAGTAEEADTRPPISAAYADSITQLDLELR